MYFFPVSGRIHVTTSSSCVVGEYLQLEKDGERTVLIKPGGEVILNRKLSQSEVKSIVMDYFGVVSNEFVITFPAR